MNNASDSADKGSKFAEFLDGLVRNNNRAALAALRRGLGKPPGTAPEMHPYVAPWLGSDTKPWQDDAYYVVAALFALHQKSWHRAADATRPTNLGASFAWLARETKSESIEKRFVALLNCHRDDLPAHLQHAVSLLKSKEVPIDWAQLLADVRRWGFETRGVQRKWAKAFWGNSPSTAPASSEQGTSEAAAEDDSKNQGN